MRKVIATAVRFRLAFGDNDLPWTAIGIQPNADGSIPENPTLIAEIGRLYDGAEDIDWTPAEKSDFQFETGLSE